MPQKYAIICFTFDEADERNRTVIRRGLSLTEAMEWCSREDTHGPGWFHGFDDEALWPVSDEKENEHVR